jgi:hypothetical protein
MVRFAASAGSLERSEARSDSKGLASPGIWTLRDSEGEDVVTATVDGVEPLRFRARVRVPVEVAHYALESQDGRTLPIETIGSTVIAGTLSFYADAAWLWRLTYRERSGTLYTSQMQGSYSRNARSLTGSQAAADPWRLDATFEDNRLIVYFSDPFDGWQEIYVKVRAAESWP